MYEAADARGKHISLQWEIQTSAPPISDFFSRLFLYNEYKTNIRYMVSLTVILYVYVYESQSPPPVEVFTGVSRLLGNSDWGPVEYSRPPLG